MIHILIKALTSSPFPDFHLCVSLLDERPSSANADEPDPLPSILPQLQQLYSLLQQCRFPAFWVLYLSEEYRVLREEYTVESVSFEDSVRKVVVRAVKAAFTKIGVERLGSYFNLEGIFSLSLAQLKAQPIFFSQGLHSEHSFQNWDGRPKMGSLSFLQTRTTRYDLRSFMRPSLFLVRWDRSHEPPFSTQLTLSYRTSQGHYTRSEDSMNITTLLK